MKKEAEKLRKNGGTMAYPKLQYPNIDACFMKEADHFLYLTHCVNDAFESINDDLTGEL